MLFLLEKLGAAHFYIQSVNLLDNTEPPPLNGQSSNFVNRFVLFLNTPIRKYLENLWTFRF